MLLGKIYWFGDLTSKSNAVKYNDDAYIYVLVVQHSHKLCRTFCLYTFETELVSASFSAYLNGHTSKKGLIFHDHHHHFIYRIIQGAAAAAIKNKQLLLLSELVYVNLCSYSPHKAHAKNLGFRIYIYEKFKKQLSCMYSYSFLICL